MFTRMNSLNKKFANLEKKSSTTKFKHKRSETMDPLISSRSEGVTLKILSLDSLDNNKSYSTGFSKYSDVWQRAKLKIRVNLALSRLLDKSSAKRQVNKQSSQIFTIKKSSRLFSTLPEVKIPKTPWFIFYPKTKFKFVWNTILALILLYTATVTPFTMAFVESTDWDQWKVIDLSIDVIFFLDFLINCLTAYYDDFDNLVSSVWKIVIHYAKSWMIIDIISFFPFNLFDSNPDSSAHRNPNNLSKFLRIPRIYRILKVSRLLKMLVHYKNFELADKFQSCFSLKNSIMRLIKSLLTIAVCLHIFACFWFFSAKIDQFGPDTWVSRYGYQNYDIGTLYLISIYWAFTTLCTVGYGDIFGFTNIEKLICIACMSSGLYFFSFTIGSLSSMMSSIDTNKDILQHKLEVIDEFAEESRLDDKLKTRIKLALKYSANRRGFSWIDKLSIINELPKHLRYEVAINMHRGAARDIKILQNKDHNLVSFIVPLLQPMFLQKDEFVYSEQEYADEIYFVIRGRISYGFEKESIPFYAVQRGDYFGDIEVVKGQPRKYSAHAVRESEVLIMNRELIKEVREKFQEFWNEIKGKVVRKEKAFEKIIIEMQEIIRLKNLGELDKVNMHAFKKHIDQIFELRCRTIRTEYQYELKDVKGRLETLAEILGSKLEVKNLKFAFSESEVKQYIEGSV